MWTIEQSETARKSDVAWLVYNGGRRFARGRNRDLQTLADKLNKLEQLENAATD